MPARARSKKFKHVFDLVISERWNKKQGERIFHGELILTFLPKVYSKNVAFTKRHEVRTEFEHLVTKSVVRTSVVLFI